MGKEEVLKRIKAAQTDTVKIEFPDMHWVSRGKIVPAKRIEVVLDEGISCAKTAEEVDYADMSVIPPDPATFSIVPYQDKTARTIADLYVDGEAFPYFSINDLKTWKNLFDDFEGDQGLSALTRPCLAGQIAHTKVKIPSLATNINSYNRHVLGNFAPYYLWPGGWTIGRPTSEFSTKEARRSALKTGPFAPPSTLIWQLPWN